MGERGSPALRSPTKAKATHYDMVVIGVTARNVKVDFVGVMRWIREAQERIAPYDSPSGSDR
ncbi:MAG: hypothetical protein ACR2KM_07835 [Gemmatimonadaceae bacterium]